jgi:hypothetical protein
MRTLSVVVVHGEGTTMFHVVAPDSPESEQPDVRYTAYAREEARRFMQQENFITRQGGD